MLKWLLIMSVICFFSISGCSKNKFTESNTVDESVNENLSTTEAHYEEQKESSNIQLFDSSYDYSKSGYTMSRNSPCEFYHYEKDGWLYGTGYTNDKSGQGKQCFQKVRESGTDRFIISQNATSIKIVEYEGDIYSITRKFSDNGDQFGLFKANGSGENFHLIVNDAYNFQIYNDEIYYSKGNPDEESWLYSCDLDGNSPKKILDEPSWFNYLIGNYIIYQGNGDEENIKIKNTGTGEVKTITHRHSYYPIFDGENIYYLGSESSSEEIYDLYKLDTRNMEETKFVENVKGPLQYVDGWLYFCYTYDGDRLYKININGKDLKMVLQKTKGIENIQVKQNYIFYTKINRDDENHPFMDGMYYANTDGTEKYNLMDSDAWNK